MRLSGFSDKMPAWSYIFNVERKNDVYRPYMLLI